MVVTNVLPGGGVDTGGTMCVLGQGVHGKFCTSSQVCYFSGGSDGEESACHGETWV